MSFARYKASAQQIVTKNDKKLIANSTFTHFTTQSSPSNVDLQTKRTFRKLNQSQEKNKEDNFCVVKDPKAQLISKFTTDIKNFYGYNEDPRKVKTLSNYYSTQSKNVTHSKASIDLNKNEVDFYYQTHVDNMQNSLNTSCYKAKYNPSKEEYVKILNDQVSSKKRKKDIAKESDKVYMKNLIDREIVCNAIEARKKTYYVERLKTEFNETNRSLQEINKTLLESNKKQELKDDQKRIKVILREENKLVNDEKYKEFYEKDYFRQALLKQIGGKQIKRNRERINKSACISSNRGCF